MCGGISKAITLIFLYAALSNVQAENVSTLPRTSAEATTALPSPQQAAQPCAQTLTGLVISRFQGPRSSNAKAAIVRKAEEFAAILEPTNEEARLVAFVNTLFNQLLKSPLFFYSLRVELESRHLKSAQLRRHAIENFASLDDANDLAHSIALRLASVIPSSTSSSDLQSLERLAKILGIEVPDILAFAPTWIEIMKCPRGIEAVAAAVTLSLLESPKHASRSVYWIRWKNRLGRLGLDRIFSTATPIRTSPGALHSDDMNSAKNLAKLYASIDGRKGVNEKLSSYAKALKPLVGQMSDAQILELSEHFLSIFRDRSIKLITEPNWHGAFLFYRIIVQRDLPPESLRRIRQALIFEISRARSPHFASLLSAALSELPTP